MDISDTMYIAANVSCKIDSVIIWIFNKNIYHHKNVSPFCSSNSQSYSVNIEDAEFELKSTLSHVGLKTCHYLFRYILPNLRVWVGYSLKILLYYLNTSILKCKARKEKIYINLMLIMRHITKNNSGTHGNINALNLHIMNKRKLI